jgi:hypothetical protein
MGKLFPYGSRNREAFARMKIKLRYTGISSVLETLFRTLLVSRLKILLFSRNEPSQIMKSTLIAARDKKRVCAKLPKEVMYKRAHY